MKELNCLFFVVVVLFLIILVKGVGHLVKAIRKALVILRLKTTVLHPCTEQNPELFWRLL